MKYGVRDTLSPMLQDLASLQTKGELVGDEWVINGQDLDEYPNMHK